MFDVIWTDPNRELVGERKIRKEAELKNREKEKEKKKKEAGRQSVSTNSSSSSTSGSTSERTFGFFSRKSREKATEPSKSKLATDSPAQSIIDESNDKRSSRQSSVQNVKAILSHEDGSEVTVKPAVGSFAPTSPGLTDGYSSSSPTESVISKWTHVPSLTTASTLTASSPRNSVIAKGEHLIQTLGPSSFVTKCTEVIVSGRNEPDVDQIVSEVHISSDKTKPQTPPIPEQPEEGAPVAFEESDTLLLTPHFQQTTPPAEYRLLTPASPVTPVRAGWNGNDHMSNPDTWKAPHEWDCSSSKDCSSPSIDERMQNEPEGGEAASCMSPDLGTLQREVRMMAAASPDLILANLKSEMGDAPDVMVYKELEMARKRWMFSAMHQTEGYGSFDKNHFSLETRTLSRPPKVLAIYETQASASFLAALHLDVTISHLSPNPIPASLFPNVQPILVPAMSASAASRPLPPQLYSAVTCLCMASLFPSAEIRPFLRHVKRCLVPGGALHLTIIDPQPTSSSMGPKLRQWLFENLLVNLEEKSRTTYPSSTFPKWLAVSRLRGKGSTITTVKAPAVAESITELPSASDQSRVKMELKCLVARMLWQEVWGSYVHAERWWWEEEDIVEECITHGTCWEYSHIVAMTEGR